MSLVKFELKDEHLKLLKALQWSKTETNHLLSMNDLDNDDVETVNITPFGGDDIIEDMFHIIYGKPEKFDPFDEDSEFGKKIYTPEQEVELKELFDELSIALSIVLYTQSFEVGHYKRKFHDIHWQKFTPKK